MRRVRLQPGEVRCGECGQPMLEAAAVVMNGQHLHPIGCFEPALKKWRRTVDAALERNVGAFSLSIEMESASPKVVRELGRLAGDVVRARRATR